MPGESSGYGSSHRRSRTDPMSGPGRDRSLLIDRTGRRSRAARAIQRYAKERPDGLRLEPGSAARARSASRGGGVRIPRSVWSCSRSPGRPLQRARCRLGPTSSLTLTRESVSGESPPEGMARAGRAASPRERRTTIEPGRSRPAEPGAGPRAPSEPLCVSRSNRYIARRGSHRSSAHTRCGQERASVRGLWAIFRERGGLGRSGPRRDWERGGEVGFGL